MPDFTALLADIDKVTFASIGIMALAGLVVGVAPGSYPLAAAAIGLAAGDGGQTGISSRMPALRLSAAYALGIAVIDALVGALFGLIGFAVLDVLVKLMVYAYFGLSILLGVAALALFRIIYLPIRLISIGPRRATGVTDAFGLGLLFGLTTCPACTPLILPIIIGASTTTDPLLGGILLFAFGIGRGVPIVLAATVTGFLARTLDAMRAVAWLERIVGLLMLGASVWLAYQGAIYAGWVTGSAAAS